MRDDLEGTGSSQVMGLIGVSYGREDRLYFKEKEKVSGRVYVNGLRVNICIQNALLKSLIVD